MHLSLPLTVFLYPPPLYGRKRYGMNLDMGIVAALTAACSVFGLPWLVAATVRSLAHVKSLTKYDQLGWGQERISGVAEQRCVYRTRLAPRLISRSNPSSYCRIASVNVLR